MKRKNLKFITDAKMPEKMKKTEALYVKISPEEKAKIERNMAIVGIANISAFVRRMCLDGGIYKIDLPEIQELIRLMNIAGNNVNQLTKRVNGGGHAYREDVAHLDGQMTECRTMLGKIMAKLAEH
jgi:hypothetical protein